MKINMKNKTLILLVLMLAFAGFGFKGCKETDRKWKQNYETDQFYNSLPVAVPRLDTLTIQTSPKGATILTQDAIPAEFQAVQFKAVDDALDRLFLSSAKYNWQSYGKHSDYTIVMVRPTHNSEVDGAGLLMTRTGVSTCGTVVSPPWYRTPKPFIVIAQNWAHPKMTRNCTKNEGEHNRAAMNDPTGVYVDFSGAGDIHPNYPLADDNEWYASEIALPQ